MAESGEPTSDRVAGILAAAERAAEELRATAEERMRERLAEADRAAEHRVRAAEEEAAELLAEARSAAEQAASQAAGEALETINRAHEEAERVRQDAAVDAERAVVGARDAAADSRALGVELTNHLEQLSGSLRANAERLLRDVSQAHAALTAGLDRAAPDTAPRRIEPRRPGAEGDGDLEVPDFVPPG